MTTKPDGGPAFAPAFPVTAGQQVYTTGMSLRAWLTGQALAGLLANRDAWASGSIGELAVEAADDAMDALAARGGRDE